ncbi:MAG: kinase [Deltaproteobacteria bacterium]|nr:kinase [Deltaproteobacteria bacterium]
MIISRTPFRISFFGGGTDYPAWYRKNGGAVLATTIDKYCYITCRYLPPFFDHRYRIVYSKVERVMDIPHIEHPSVKAVLGFMGIKDGMEVHHDGDLPARTGLGSSSAFTVGILNALHAYKGCMSPKKRLAKEAIHIERNVLRENVGSQDQALVAIGGFNKVEFTDDDDFLVTPITIGRERLEGIEKHLLLYFTGFSRYASEVAKAQIENTEKKKPELAIMQQMVDEAISIINAPSSHLDEFGRLLHEAWMLKRSLSDRITNPKIDEIYEAARSSGAIGGKLLGAGGGGFMLFFAKPTDQPLIEQRLKGLLRVPFRFENQGSQIIFFQPDITPEITKGLKYANA